MVSPPRVKVKCRDGKPSQRDAGLKSQVVLDVVGRPADHPGWGAVGMVGAPAGSLEELPRGTAMKP